MPSLTEIQNRISSISDTLKITKAMNMIASNKLRKAKSDLEANQPFYLALENEIRRILRHTPDFEHIYFDNRQKDQAESVKRKGFIVITADKGMAGAYNSNILKEAMRQIEGVEDFHLYVIGQVGHQFFNAKHIPITESFSYTAQNPTLHRAREIAFYMVDLILKEEIDEIYLIFTSMSNSVTEEVVVEKLLPLQQSKLLPPVPDELKMSVYQEEFKLEPSIDMLLDNLVPNYLTGTIYGALIESFCCEQSARMQAMDSATRNGEDMLKDLQISYNRIRQAVITQEINEVVGGAKALRRKKSK